MKKQLLCFVLTIAILFTTVSHKVMATGEDIYSNAGISDTTSTTETVSPEATTSTTETVSPEATTSTTETVSPEVTTSTTETVSPEATTSTTETVSPEATTSTTENVDTPSEEVTTYVAESNGQKFTSLQEAIDAAEDGVVTTITLLGDVTLVGESIEIPPAKKITLDLDNYTITGVPTEEEGYKVIEVAQQFKDENKNESAFFAELTIKNGTVVCDCGQLQQGTIDYAIDTIRNHGNLTIENATIINNSIPDQLGYAIDNHSGFATTTVTVKSSNIEAYGSGYCDGIRQYDIAQMHYDNNLIIDDYSNVSTIWVQTVADPYSLVKQAVSKAIHKVDNQNHAGYFSDVTGALGVAAHPGETVIVLKDSSMPMAGYMVQQGVTLDLNGKSISCFLVYLMASSVIVDSADGEGSVSANSFIFSSYDFPQMPLYDKEVGGYRFFDYSVKFGRDIKTYDPAWYLLAKIDFTNVKAYELLATGESQITFACDISFQTSDSAEKTTIPHWRIETAKLQEYAQNAIAQMNSGTEVTAVLGVLITGLEAINGGKLYANLYIEATTTTGFEKSSGEKTFAVNITDSTTTN